MRREGGRIPTPWLPTGEHTGRAYGGVDEWIKDWGRATQEKNRQNKKQMGVESMRDSQ